jgi:hypothetical protein
LQFIREYPPEKLQTLQIHAHFFSLLVILNNLLFTTMTSRLVFLLLLALAVVVSRSEEVCKCTCAATSSTGSCDESFRTGYSDETMCEEECSTQCAELVGTDTTISSNLTCVERGNGTAPGADPFHDFEGDDTPDEPTRNGDESKQKGTGDGSDAFLRGACQVGWTAFAAMLLAITL